MRTGSSRRQGPKLSTFGSESSSRRICRPGGTVRNVTNVPAQSLALLKQQGVAASDLLNPPEEAPVVTEQEQDAAAVEPSAGVPIGAPGE